MNQQSKNVSITALRWTLGLVVLWQSIQFAFSPSAIHHFASAGLPSWIRPAIAGIEIIAALLFLIPWTNAVGSRLLLFVFAIAVILHILHGDYDVSVLVLYVVAVIVCMTHRNTGLAGAA